MMDRVPLVLLPGMVSDAAYWQAQAETLSGIATPAIVEFGMLDDFGAMAERVLAQAPERFALAGHSMGGRVAQEVYRRAPERISKMALLATDYRGHISEDARRQEAEARDEMLALAARSGMEVFARSWLHGLLAPESLAQAPLVETIVTMIARHPPQELAAHTLAGLRRRDYADVLGLIDVPVLILAGAVDSLRSPAVHREMANLIRDSRLVVVPDCGHMLAMEQPEAVNRAMREWLLA